MDIKTEIIDGLTIHKWSADVTSPDELKEALRICRELTAGKSRYGFERLEDKGILTYRAWGL